jgi:predicted nucleic acid-binding protein
MKKGEQVEKKIESEKKKQKVPKWKAQSIALRAHVKLGMDENYQLTKEEEEMLSQERHIDVVDCPYCGRHFNKNAAKAHVPFCKAQAEKQAEK